MGLTDTHHVRRIVLHPASPDIGYVAALAHLWGANTDLRDSSAAPASIGIVDAAGQQVASRQGPHVSGINRVVWNLRYDPLPPGPPDEESGGRSTSIPGPFVVPGEYTIRLSTLGLTREQTLRVIEDPRIRIPAADRKACTGALLAIAETYRGAVSVLEEANRRSRRGSNDVRGAARELQSRLATLYRDMSQSTAKPTADQHSQMQFFTTELEGLRKRAAQ